MQSTQHPATLPGDDVSNPADILRAAAVYLRRYGWTQHCYYRHTLDSAARGSFPPACAAGAIRMAVLGRTIDDPDQVACDPLMKTGYRAIIAAEALLADLVDPQRAPGASVAAELIHDWNDAPARTREQVITTLHTAAAAATVLAVLAGAR